MIFVYFYDCPRTGGTTIKRWCKSNRNKVRRVHFGKNPPWNHVPYRSPLILSKELGVCDKLWTFTMLRDPYEHTASLYAKIRKHDHAYCCKLKGLSFSKWIHSIYAKDVKLAPAPWGFSMVRFYDEDTEDLSKAIHNIESMDFVGFTESLDKDMNRFLLKSGSNIKFDANRANIVPRNFKITDDDRKIIREVRSEDFKLVNYFRKKLNLSLFKV